MPKGGWPLAGGLAAFVIIILAVVAWAALSGRAGSQRGLVIHSERPDEVVVSMDDGQSATLAPGRREHTFVVKKEQFPATFTARDAAGNVLFERRFEYEDLVEADFRISLDDRGFYPTTDLREPAPTPTSAG